MEGRNKSESRVLCRGPTTIFPALGRSSRARFVDESICAWQTASLRQRSSGTPRELSSRFWQTAKRKLPSQVSLFSLSPLRIGLSTVLQTLDSFIPRISALVTKTMPLQPRESSETSETWDELSLESVGLADLTSCTVTAIALGFEGTPRKATTLIRDHAREHRVHCFCGNRREGSLLPATSLLSDPATLDQMLCQMLPLAKSNRGC